MRYSSKEADLLRRAHDALRREWELVKQEFHARKFDPNQPRAPAGSADGGRWTSGAGGAGTTTETTGERIASKPLESFAAARRSGRSMAYCLRQLAIDNLLCASLEPATVRAACRAQAMERFANCIVGRPIPPLPF